MNLQEKAQLVARIGSFSDSALAIAAVEKALADAIQSERDACAAVADNAAAWCRSYGAEDAVEEVARLIRARSDEC